MRRNIPKKPAELTRAQAMRAAMLWAPAVWGTGSLLGLASGKGLTQAISSGGASALGGLILCAIYYLITPRDGGTGLILLGMNQGPLMSAKPLSFWAGAFEAPLLILPWVLLFHVIAAREARRAKAADPRAADPMYDAETDRRAGTPGAD